MSASPPRTWYSSAMYVVLVIITLAVKPRFAFREDGTMKDFGTGEDRSVFSFGAITGASAVVSSMVFAVADLINAYSLSH